MNEEQDIEINRKIFGFNSSKVILHNPRFGNDVFPESINQSKKFGSMR